MQLGLFEEGLDNKVAVDNQLGKDLAGEVKTTTNAIEIDVTKAALGVNPIQVKPSKQGDKPGRYLLKNDTGTVEEARAAAGLPPLRPAKRKCLRCDEMFDSADVDNRICDRCKELKSVADLDGVKLSELQALVKNLGGEEDDVHVDALSMPEDMIVSLDELEDEIAVDLSGNRISREEYYN